ncbi:putative sulfate exporter family transporter, partial [Desulfosarcina sp. OttesenSCG-928-G17]|nr:putative sulfate exporter family transporter [Desulfosarcina sp. OttesenSCG-928-G17]
YTEPMVAGGWMGLAVKSDGGAIASGAIVDALIRTKAIAVQGIEYQEGWIVMVTTTVKIFIDVFIGVWSFVLAYIWTKKFEKSSDGRTMTMGDVWQRFPRFVLGYIITFLILLLICLYVDGGKVMGKSMTGPINSMRVMFFLFTFFTIGLVSNFRKLWAEGIGKLAAVYAVCLFGFIIWIGLFISWLFFHGVYPPVVAG